ncbi:MAG: hypothetical protein GX319_06810 [Clostridiales bacterium]|nr:hypothetical protein [Clostridiales bacterium]
MNLIISLGLLFVFVIWLQYQLRKNDSSSKKAKYNYWKRESQANTTRKSDISMLDYIHLPIDRLPLEDNADPTVNSYRDTILSHSNKKILNLSSFSNTELKLKYGASNINLLSEYDNNYLIIISILHKWGERLYTNGYPEDALAVLETAIECKTDVHKTYCLLAKIYLQQDRPDKIDNLLDIISSIPIRDKENLLRQIQTIKDS